MSKKNRKPTDHATTPELSETIAKMIASLTDFPNPVLVVGDGWAAMAAVGFLATAGEEASRRNVLWITNSGARALSPLPFVETGIAAEGWKALFHKLGIASDEPQAGHYLREFKHRSFSRPAWHKSPTPEMRKETITEWVWGPEARFAPVFETRFDTPFAELEEKAREKLAALPNVRTLTGVPIAAFELEAPEGEQPKAVLASGEKIPFDRAIWADRWVGLGAIEGLPKGSALSRNREPMGILQAVFTHSSAIVPQAMQEAFFGGTHKDAGEEINRSVWGYFFDGGRRSVWTLFLTEEEGIDNQAIARKFRRMKQALERMFTGPEWLPEGAKDLFATVSSEQLIFHEDFVFASGEAVAEPQFLGKKEELRKVAFVTDAFGPSVAMEEVARLLSDELGLGIPLETARPAVTETPGAEAPAS
jgi:hypothetical protein